MEKVLHETCQQYLNRRLSEGWKIVGQYGHIVILSPPDGSFLRPVDLRNDIETLRPNAAGDETNLSPYGDTENWDCVDEETPDEDGTYVYNTESTLRDLYNLPPSTGSGTINYITVYARCKTQVQDVSSVYLCIKSDTTVTEGSEQVVTESYDNYSEQWNNNPADSEGWERSDIDGLQIGIKQYAYGRANNSRCTQVYVEVDYTPVAGLENKSASMASKLVAAGAI